MRSGGRKWASTTHARRATIMHYALRIARMRIALYNLTTTTRWGGVENFVWEVEAQLRERGHSVDIFGGRGPEHLGRRPPGVRLRLYPYVDRDVWRRIPLLGRQYTLTKLLERL